MKKYLLIITLALLSYNAGAQTQKALRDSIARISELLELRPYNIELRLRKAALNIELEQWKYALDEYTKVLEFEPKNIAALYYRAFVNQHLGRYSFARQDYEAVLDQTPIDKHALMGLVLTNIADKHNTAAYDGANRLVDMFPNDPNVYEVRAEVEEKLNMLEASLDDINKAIELEEAKLKRQKRTTITLEDDMVSYQLTAFSLNNRLNNRSKAKENLDYLVQHGIAKAQLNDYFLRVSK